MAEIPLVHSVSGLSKCALVDDFFSSILSKFTWKVNESGYVYAADSDKGEVLLHRLIMGVLNEPQKIIEHVNSNTLDNRLINLRVVESPCTSSLQKTSSNYRGVSQVVPGGRWKASGTLNARTYYLGLFDTELEAAQYAAAWRRTHKAQYTQDDEELATAFPDPVPLKPKRARQKLRVKVNINSYSVFVYDKGMGNKASLYIATLPKDAYSFEDALNLQKVCQSAWDRKDFDYVNSVRAQHGTL